jgi:hypothetical protein
VALGGAIGIDAYGNTHVSSPSAQYGAQGTVAPGANGPGANMQVHHALMLIVGTAAVLLVGIGIVFRRPIGE